MPIGLLNTLNLGFHPLPSKCASNPPNLVRPMWLLKVKPKLECLPLMIKMRWKIWIHWSHSDDARPGVANAEAGAGQDGGSAIEGPKSGVAAGMKYLCGSQTHFWNLLCSWLGTFTMQTAEWFNMGDLAQLHTGASAQSWFGHDGLISFLLEVLVTYWYAQ